MAFIVKSEPGSKHREGLRRVNPIELADNLNGIAPADLPIMSTCFIVEKMDVAICDGKGNWYVTDSGGSVRSITAGQSWAELF